MGKKDQKILRKVARFKRQQIEEILREVEAFRRDAEKQNLNVTTVSREELDVKLSKANSPIIVFQAWTSAASSPGTVDYRVGIHNPDPVNCGWVFAHVFMGLANIAPDVGAAAAVVDPRFPRLTLPKFSGLSIAPGTTESLRFAIPIPAGIEDSNYLGNTFVFRASWHDVGEYLDRSLFVFEVT